MSPKTIAVLGATGVQGGSVVRALLKDRSWKIRGITRDASKEAAKALEKQGVEVVSANIDDEQSLLEAFEGVQAIFAVTNFWEHLFMGATALEARDKEVEQGIKLAIAASKTASLKHYIWSSLPGGEKTSGGKFAVPHCDSKAIIDDYIFDKLPELAKKTTFLWVGYYASNIAFFPMCKVEHLEPAGKYIWTQPCAPNAILPMAGDVSVNIGLYASAILHNPSVSLPAKYTFVITENISCADTLKVWSAVTGHPAEYVEASPEKFDALFPKAGGELAAQLKWGETVPDWATLREGMVSGEELGVDEKELVGLKGFLEGVKGMLTA